MPQILQKRKVSHWLGRHHTEATKAKLRAVNLGKSHGKHTEETKQKISQTKRAMGLKRPDLAERNRQFAESNIGQSP